MYFFFCLTDVTLHTYLISLFFILLPGVRAKSGQLSVHNLPPVLAWTALFLSLMVPSFPFWGYWVMYCSFKPSLRLPPNDHSHPPLYEGDGLSLLHTDCLLWPVPSSGPNGQPKGSVSSPRIKKCLQLQTTPLFLFSGCNCFLSRSSFGVSL